ALGLLGSQGRGAAQEEERKERRHACRRGKAHSGSRPVATVLDRPTRYGTASTCKAKVTNVFEFLLPPAPTRGPGSSYTNPTGPVWCADPPESNQLGANESDT